MKIKIIAKTDAGKDALDKALWVKENPKEAEALVGNFKRRFMLRQTLKYYELVVIDEDPFTVEYEVRKVAQLMAKDPKVEKSIHQMMSEYGAEPTDYEVTV